MLEAKEAPTPAHRKTRRQERAEKEQAAAEALAAAKDRGPHVRSPCVARGSVCRELYWSNTANGMVSRGF